MTTIFDENWQSRTQLLIGPENVKILNNAHVLVAGLGGVGSAAAEMLCRAGIGKLTLADGDIVRPSNRNRQLIATLSTEGLKKTQVMSKRLLDINPDIQIQQVDIHLKDEALTKLISQKYDYVVDAIDSLSPKVYLLFHAVKNNQKVVSSMGAAAKFDPSKILIADISQTHTCTFAFDIRKRLRRLGIHTGIKAVFSSEPPVKSSVVFDTQTTKKSSIAGTISYLPVIFGCFCASVVIRDLIHLTGTNNHETT